MMGGMKSPTHVLCKRCCGATEIDRDLDAMDCASCGCTDVEAVCIVACPRPSTYTLPGESWRCSLPFHDYGRDVHVVPWEQRDMLIIGTAREHSIEDPFTGETTVEVDL